MSGSSSGGSPSPSSGSGGKGKAAKALARRRKQPRTQEEEEAKREEAKAKARERKRKWRMNPENVRKEREAKKSRVAARRQAETGEPVRRPQQSHPHSMHNHPLQQGVSPHPQDASVYLAEIAHHGKPPKVQQHAPQPQAKGGYGSVKSAHNTQIRGHDSDMGRGDGGRGEQGDALVKSHSSGMMSPMYGSSHEDLRNQAIEIMQLRHKEREKARFKQRYGGGAGSGKGSASGHSLGDLECMGSPQFIGGHPFLPMSPPGSFSYHARMQPPPCTFELSSRPRPGVLPAAVAAAQAAAQAAAAAVAAVTDSSCDTTTTMDDGDWWGARHANSRSVERNEKGDSTPHFLLSVVEEEYEKHHHQGVSHAHA